MSCLYKVTSSVEGTLYCEKANPVIKIAIAGKIESIEEKIDKRGNPYFSIFILNAGEKEAFRWNFFDKSGKDFELNDFVKGDGVFYTENKRLLRNLKKVK